MRIYCNTFNLLVTRPKHQADTLCHLIEQQGWNAIRFPTLEIVAVNNGVIKQQLEKIEQHQWLIFISVNAVNFALSANDGKIEQFKSVPIAAMGKATEKALQKVGLTVELVPEDNFNTEGLLETDEMMHVEGKSCLIIRGEGGRETLADRLRERNASVEYMEVYARKRPVCNDLNMSELLQQNSLDVITITSGDALTNLWGMIQEKFHNKLQAVPLIVISHRIKALAEQYNFKHIAVTESPGDTAIIKTAKMSFSKLTIK